MSFVWTILTVNSSSFRKMGFAKASFTIISSTIMQQFASEMLDIFCCYWFRTLWFAWTLLQFLLLISLCLISIRHVSYYTIVLVSLSWSSIYQDAFPNVLCGIWRDIKYFQCLFHIFRGIIWFTLWYKSYFTIIGFFYIYF